MISDNNQTLGSIKKEVGRYLTDDYTDLSAQVTVIFELKKSRFFEKSKKSKKKVFRKIHLLNYETQKSGNHH